ncbi:hypothetical protein AB0M54_12610 [Actinoplanes sp. NPDC051470]|uniref:hypothetical protein n=1 Tax=Actinoplanes sp. NPDC051470 TaxID=3157224 RepID=UPI00341DCC6B
MDEPVTLATLLGEPEYEETDISPWCRTRRAQRILAKNGLALLSQLMATKVKDLRRIPDCGAVSLTDILEATLLAVVDGADSGTQGILPLPGLSGGETFLTASAPAQKTSPDGPVSDPLLDILESR